MPYNSAPSPISLVIVYLTGLSKKGREKNSNSIQGEIIFVFLKKSLFGKTVHKGSKMFRLFSFILF